jgi:hypothetical protein
VKLAPICEMQLHYTWIDYVDYGVGGHRGIIYTADEAKVYFEFNGVALLRPEDKARVFTTSLSLRTGDARYSWVNDTVGAAEGILNTTTDQMTVRAYACENELATALV